MDNIFNIIMEMIKKLIFPKAPDNHYNTAEMQDTIKKDGAESSLTKIKWFHFVNNTKITSPFGGRWIFTSTKGKKKWNNHRGTDYTGLNKTAKAPCDCIITKILKYDTKYPYKYKWTKDGFIYTNPPKNRAWTPYVELTAIHDSSLKFVYKHGDTNNVVGDIIKGGFAFFKVDSYGNSQGTHLHQEVIINNKYVDPDKFINKKLSEV